MPKQGPVEEHKPPEKPQEAIERIVNTVLYEVFQNQSLPRDVRRRAREFASNFDYADATYLGPEARRAQGREYDEWIDEIFRSTQNGDWREDLLAQFMRKLGHFMAADKSDALFAVVIEEITAEHQFVRYQLAEHLGNTIHAHHWRNFGEQLADGKDRAFFRALLDAQPQQADIGAWHGRSITDVYPYTNELDTLLKTAEPANKAKLDILDDFWLSAIVLKSQEADQPHRLLMIAYPNHGTAASPKVGRAAAQEWRILQLLRIAYRQLDHEIKYLDKRIAAQRGDMIRDLGPGFLAHELHTHLANLHDLHILMANDIQTLLARYPSDADLHAVGTRVLQSAQETTRVFQVVHGYNNLMRARRVESFSLAEVLEEAIALVRVRAREYANASLQVERKRAAVPMTTDHALLLVVLVNVLVNATHAIHEARPPVGKIAAPVDKDRIVILVESEPQDPHVVLLIANTGPEIAPELRERIFKRGYTTRSLGHGQGLYLCKQIMEFLGGSITYADPWQRGLFVGTGFRLELTRNLSLNKEASKK